MAFAHNFELIQKSIGSLSLSQEHSELTPIGDNLSPEVREFSIKVENTVIKLLLVS